MRVDHVSYAAEHDGLQATAARLADTLGVRALNGGVHPNFGTRNVILPLAHDRYLEVVEVLDHPASDKAPFGQAVRACSEAGGGWLGWVVRVEDISVLERRVGARAVAGHRRFPDGRVLHWRQLGVKGLVNDPQLPFIVEFDNPELHPSTALRELPAAALRGMTVAGDLQRVRHWLGVSPECAVTDLEFTFIAPHGTAGLLSVTFETPAGTITV